MSKRDDTHHTYRVDVSEDSAVLSRATVEYVDGGVAVDDPGEVEDLVKYSRGAEEPLARVYVANQYALPYLSAWLGGRLLRAPSPMEIDQEEGEPIFVGSL